MGDWILLGFMLDSNCTVVWLRYSYLCIFIWYLYRVIDFGISFDWYYTGIDRSRRGVHGICTAFVDVVAEKTRGGEDTCVRI